MGLEREIVYEINPFRYRGYYYDTETGLYYLNSRYYDPTTGRFINADNFISTGQGLAGFNMYSYCNNNPILYVDGTGNLPIVENDDTCYPMNFCTYINKFNCAKQEDNIAAFNVETMLEYLDGAGGGLSYSEYEALKCWSITTGKPMWAYDRSNDSLDEIIFSSFLSTSYLIEATFHDSVSMNCLQGVGAGFYAYGMVVGMVDKWEADYMKYYGDPVAMYTAMGISGISSIVTSTLNLTPAQAIGLSFATPFVEEGVKFFVIIICMGR